MQTITSIINRTFISLMILVQIVFYPAAAFASETAHESSGETATTSETEPAPAPPPSEEQQAPPPSEAQQSNTTEPTDTSRGPQSPTGSGNDTYTYNEETGRWENEHYSWDPETKQTSPKQEQTYSYNPETGMWDTTEWRYNPATGKYEANTVSTRQNPFSAMQSGTNQNTGPGSNNTINNTSGNNGAFDLFYNTRISSTITSIAQSGDASVLMNTNGGDAISGNARALATILNMIQSSWSPHDGTLNTFITNIDGDVVGDLYIDPTAADTRRINTNQQAYGDLEVNVSNNALIDNDIRLTAHSGDATVALNTNAGSATSGSADAIANVVNMINSSISAGDSFLGIINIRGNFEGDILVPEQFLSGLLASNAPRATINTAAIENSELLADFNNSSNITNTVSATAASGNASVRENTSAGNATTGDASTNVTIFNLTGSNVIGSNALLVFVNVLGEWVGVITNAPTGSTAAALGSGSVQNNSFAQSADIDVNNSHRINNDIILDAQSGDASVNSNTNAGNATSGNARAAANLLNISNSNFGFSDWFGVLFINVLGKWHGSFGIDTAMGDRPAVAAPVPSAGSPQDVRVFQFVPASSSSESKRMRLQPIETGAVFAANAPVQTASNDTNNDESYIAGATSNKPLNDITSPIAKSAVMNWQWLAVGGMIALALLGLDRLLALRQRRFTEQPL